MSGKKTDRKKYKIVGECVEVRGACPFWCKGDEFEYDDCLKIRETGIQYGTTIGPSKIQTGLLCTYSVCQLHPILVAMGRGGVGADELGLGNTPDIAYVSCEAPAIGDSPKAHGQVVWKLTRIPVEISQADLFFDELKRKGLPWGRYAEEPHSH
jgi:uncharacterized repeat protein (TIGR04076 family)